MTIHEIHSTTEVNGLSEILHRFIHEHIQEHIDEQEHMKEHLFNMNRLITDQMCESRIETDRRIHQIYSRINQTNMRINDAFRRIDTLTEHLIDLINEMQHAENN